ncbi:MAG: cytochrome c [Terracidiphilus sp.]
MLKSFLLFTAVVLLVTAAASAPARPPQESGQGAASKKVNPEQLAKAKRVYNMDCALCHGATGDGKTDIAKDMQLTLDDWTDPKALATQSDEALINVIRKGKGKMPPEDTGRATNDEVRGLVVYIRKLASNQPAPATAQPVATPAPGATPAPAETPAPATSPATPPPATSPSK